jgi:hypothetical protein
MGRLFKSPPRFVVRKLILAVAILSLPACLPTGGGDHGQCEKDFDIAVTPDKITGNKVYVSLSKLSFLEEGNFILTDVDLEGTVAGHHRDDEDFDLDMNGIKLSRQDGGRMCDHRDKDGDDDHAHFKLHKMFLNGGLTFELFLLKLKLQKGQLVLGLAARGGYKLKDAVVHFKGKSFGKCPPAPNPNPSPSPNPQPKPAAVTHIDSVTPSASHTSSLSISFAFSADQTGVAFWCALDGSAAAKCTSPQNYTGLVNGSHTFSVYSQNASGVNETPPKSYTWTVDTVAPTVTITNAGSLPSLTNQSVISFQFSSDEASTFQCSLDNGAYAVCTSPQAYGGLAEGAHTFAVQAIDDVGNVSGAPATFNWNIDTTAPITTINTVTPAADLSNIMTKAFEFSASETANFDCSIDHGSFQACTSPVSLSGLADGAHYFEVRATDLAGNQGVAVSVAWKVDTVAPAVSFGAVTPLPGLTMANTLSADFSANEPGTLYCSQDGAAAAVCTSPLTWQNVSDGTHVLAVYAVDSAGNQGAATSVQWQVDTTAPAVSFMSITPSPAAYINSPNMGFDLNSSENAVLSMTLNGAVIASANPLALNGLADGSYELSVTATDDAGNVSQALVHDWVIDTVAPGLTLTSSDGASPTRSDTRTFTFSASESVTYKCNVDSAGYAACASPLALSGLADGSHEVDVIATDLAGNQTTAIAQWIVDTAPPVTTLSASQQNSSIVFTFTANETSTFTCAMDSASPSACTSPVSYAGLEPGQHTFTVYATDAAGNSDAGSSHTFMVLPPITTSITSRSPAGSGPTQQTTASFAFTANQQATFVCSLDGAAATACVSPVNYTNLANGAHTFRVYGVDQFGSQDQTGASASWTVDTIAPSVNNLVTSATTNSITVTWTTSENASQQVKYGVGVNITSATVESSTFGTTHSVTISGLTANSVYTVEAAGHDQAGNAYISSSRQVRTNR